MTFDDSITRPYLYVEDCPPRERHMRIEHVHRLDRSAFFTPREWAWLVVLAMTIALAVGFR